VLAVQKGKKIVAEVVRARDVESSAEASAYVEKEVNHAVTRYVLYDSTCIQNE